MIFSEMAFKRSINKTKQWTATPNNLNCGGFVLPFKVNIFAYLNFNGKNIRLGDKSLK